MTQGETPSLDVRRHQYNAVFKVHRYPTNYPGLQGKDLAPRGTIELYPGLQVDSDHDGMADVWEIAHFGSTTNAGTVTDSDGDGLADLDEYRRGTRPDLKDTDADGAPDGWEAANGLNPAYGIDGRIDSDRDGLLNAEEYVVDTGPWDPSSVLAITDTYASAAGIRVQWIGGNEAMQYLECREALGSSAGQWTVIYTNPPETPTTNALIHAGTTNRVLFYRVRAARE
jgi:hypothetical protein